MPTPVQTNFATLGVHETRLQGWLANHYEPKIRELLAIQNMRDLLFKNRTEKVQMMGEFYQWPIESELPSGAGNRDDEGILPQATDTKLWWAKMDTRNVYATAQFNRKVLTRISNTSSAEALFRGIDHKLQMLTKSLVHLNNCNLFSDGMGIKAIVQAPAVNSNTVYIKYWDGSDNRGALFFLLRRHLITIRDAVTKAVKYVTMVDKVNFGNGGTPGYVTTTDPVTVNVGDIICYGDANGDDYGLAINGLFSLFGSIGTGSYCNINFSDVPEWEPLVDDNGGNPRNYSYEAVLEAMMRVQTETGDDMDIDTVVCNPTLWLEHEKLYRGTVQYATWDMEMGVSMNRPVYNWMGNRMPVMQSKYMRPDSLAMLASATWGVVQDMPFSFDREANGGLLKWVQGRDAVALYGRAYEDMICFKPRSNVLLTNFRTRQSFLRA